MELELVSLISRQTLAASRTESRSLLPGGQFVLLRAWHKLVLLQGRLPIPLNDGDLVLASGPLYLALARHRRVGFSGAVYRLGGKGAYTAGSQQWRLPITDPNEKESLSQWLDDSHRSEQALSRLDQWIRSRVHPDDSAVMPAIDASFAAKGVNPKLMYIYRYIRQHYDQPLTLSELSGLIGFHPAYLSHLYKKQFLISPMHHLQQIRMEKARQQVLESENRIKDIARELGYVSSSQFGSIYKRYYGVSPNEDRNSIRSERMS